MNEKRRELFQKLVELERRARAADRATDLDKYHEIRAKVLEAREQIFTMFNNLELPENLTIKHNVVAVDETYFWRPMETCPRSVKVQLLNPDKVAIYGQYHGESFWRGWAPLPSTKD